MKQMVAKVMKQKDVWIIPSKVPVWDIEYSYISPRGNMKTRNGTIASGGFDKQEVKEAFHNHVEEFNKQFPNKAMLKAEILSIKYSGEMTLCS